MSSRARITLGIALLLLVGGVIVREIPWLAWPLTFVGIFLVIWGRAPSKTERVIAQLPGGKFLLTGLDQVDMILMPRDRYPWVVESALKNRQKQCCIDW